jgi:asparagine synthase (glutamine-hydrolysing)
MCGIAGEARLGGGVAEASLRAMSSAIHHRGPDDDGIWVDSESRCGFGFRRLAIIDLSPAGHQPMQDPLTGNVIVFNGEIYNYQALRKACEEQGDRFVSQSDTEVILALYRRHGTQCFAMMRGMFAIAIWDARSRKLILARDRLGKKPLNYFMRGDQLIFCSEINGLVRHPDVPRDIDPQGLELYLQIASIPEPHTIYRSIRKLPPAHYAVFSTSGLRIERYWLPEFEPKLKLSEADALDAFQEKLTEAVRLRMIADVPLGALLSGGVDSSVVVAEMARLSSKPVETFSIGFEEDAFNEAPYAEQVAKVCGTHHHTRIVRGDLPDLLPKVAHQYGEPFADPSAVPSFVVSRIAREYVTVALNGDGGDELLGGYPRYALTPSTLALARLLSPVGSLTGAERLSSAVYDRSEFAGRLLGRAIRGGVFPELGSMTNARQNWNERSRAALMGALHDANILPSWRARWLKETQQHAVNPIDRMLYLDSQTHLPNDLLVKMDIASMHCSLEARSPLLDHELFEFCARLPVNMKVKGGTGKYFLKVLAERRFGKAFAYRKKQGFGIPVAQWLKGPLRDTLVQVLSDKKAMAPLDGNAVSAVLRKFLDGRSVDGGASRMWVLLMYGLWRAQA